MSNSWRQAYTELTEFIAERSEVDIRASVVSIPDSVRPEFYRLFDTVRVTFLEEKFPALFDEAKNLSRSYTAIEEDVIKLLGLADVTLPVRLDWFLHDPTDGLLRPLFDPLFDLLKGKVNAEAFEQEATRTIESSFRALHRSGYTKWVGLSLVRLLEADKAFVVACPAFLGEEGMTNYSEEKVAPPEESKHLRFDFGQGLSFLLAVPDFIVHSAKIDRYVAVRSALDEAKWAASNASEKKDWYTLDSIKARYGLVGLEPDLIICVGERPEDIALVADADRICRPDLIVECREQKDWLEKEGLGKVKLHHDVLKPKLGTYIVSREAVPEEAYKEFMPEEVSKEPAPEQEQKFGLEQEPEKQQAGIRILTVGFDQSMLKPIISTLMAQEDKEQ